MLEKTLESPLDSKEIKPVNPKGNQPWIFTGRTDADIPILWPPDPKSQSLKKTLMLGKIKGKRRRGWQRMRWWGSITDSMVMNLSKLQEIMQDRGAWPAAVHGVKKSQTWLSNWTTTKVVGIQNGTTTLENSFTSFEAKKTNQKNLKIYDPAIPLLGVYATEMRP